MSDSKNTIHPEMSVLDIVSRYKQTEIVFKRYDAQAGECICCQALFDSLLEVAKRYHIDLKSFMVDLEAAG